MVRRGNDQMGKEKDKVDIAKEANKAEKAKEEDKVRVYGDVETGYICR